MFISISESLANPTLELIAVGNLLPRMSFDTEKSPDPPYIYRALIYIEGRGELFNKNVGPPLGFLKIHFRLRSLGVIKFIKSMLLDDH